MSDHFSFYEGKKVLVTGHTGFKGAWLVAWLHQLGTDVSGFALDPPSTLNLFSSAKLHTRIKDVRGDVRSLPQLKEAFTKYRPDIVFHLAAQPLVLESYRHPIDTFTSNVMGTANVLECIREHNTKSAVVITSDKCYKNQEQLWGYQEHDELGGSDPYSASKSCAELVVKSYNASFFHDTDINVATARAGNVIGGGDWAADRIVPDAIRSLTAGVPIDVRNPSAKRPWQHVLEPLS